MRPALLLCALLAAAPRAAFADDPTLALGSVVRGLIGSVRAQEQDASRLKRAREDSFWLSLVSATLDPQQKEGRALLDEISASPWPQDLRQAYRAQGDALREREARLLLDSIQARRRGLQGRELESFEQGFDLRVRALRDDVQVYAKVPHAAASLTGLSAGLISAVRSAAASAVGAKDDPSRGRQLSQLEGAARQAAAGDFAGARGVLTGLGLQLEP